MEVFSSLLFLQRIFFLPALLNVPRSVPSLTHTLNFQRRGVPEMSDGSMSPKPGPPAPSHEVPGEDYQGEEGQGSDRCQVWTSRGFEDKSE